MKPLEIISPMCLALALISPAGSWFSEPQLCRTAFRDWSTAEPRSRFYGLRVVVEFAREHR